MVTTTQSSNLFAEEDLPRLFRRSVADVDPENPPEGYEPVLEVTIPGEVSFEKGARKPVFEPSAVGAADCEWDTHRYVDLDAKLMNLLTKPFVGTEPVDLTERELIDPAVDPSRRMFVAYFDEVLDDFLEAVDPDDHNERRLARQMATTRVSAHETDGHFQSLIHPKTACPRAFLTWQGTLDPTPTDPPLLSHRYEEVRSIAAEEATFERMVDEDDPIVRTVAEDVAEQARDRYARASGGIADILAFLEGYLTREEILEVLDIARETHIYPEQWLCHVLYDLASGRAREPADFRTDAASYWEIKTSKGGVSYEDSHNDTVNWRTESAFSNSVVEMVTVGDGGITRRWLAYNPTSLTDGAIRILLFQREHLSIREELIGRPLINNGVEPAGHVVLRFQDEGWNPFERAMASEGDEETLPEELAAAFDYQFDEEAYERTFYQAAVRTCERLGFDNSNDFQEWVRDERGSIFDS